MNDAQQAKDYADAWVHAWNNRDLDGILKHYADDVVFRSPRIEAVTGEKAGFVKGVDNLRAYWTKALSLATEIHFELERVYWGKNTITIAYKNHRGQHVAETLVFNDQGVVVEGIVTHV